ncbi:MAG TPA: outer membrane lipoprotein chaperone LolA [Terriglobales bacterium]|jgi:outer membrane lipoprotein carrier protein
MRNPALIAILVLTAAFARVDGGSGASAIAKAVDEHYNRLQTLQVEFTESYQGAGMERTESGTLWLKKPGKMRWEYRSPREKLFLSDGKTAWLYVPDDRQARKMPVKKLDDWRSPLGFLLGKTKLEKELQGLSMAQDVPSRSPGNWVLRGVPKAWEGRVEAVVLEITPEHRIVRIQINETDGSVTEFRFDHQQENVLLDGARFQFVPPAGTEVVAGEPGQ